MTWNPNPTRIQGVTRNLNTTRIQDVTRNPNRIRIQGVTINPYSIRILDTLTYDGGPIKWACAKKMKEALHMPI